MDVWGLILSGIGAVLIAAGQEIVTRVTAVWLRAQKASLSSLVGPGDVLVAPEYTIKWIERLEKMKCYLVSAGPYSSLASSYRSFRIFGTMDGERFVSHCLICANHR